MATNKSDIAAWMSAANDPLMQDDVACNPECPAEVLIWMAKNVTTSTFDGISSNPSLPLEAIIHLAQNSKDEYEKINLFSLPNFDKSAFDILVADKQSAVREEATRWASPETLEKMSKDTDAWVRRNVAMNEMTPKKTLLELANDADADVVSSLTLNKNCPKEVWEVVLNNTEFDERQASVIAENITEELIGLAREKFPVKYHYRFLTNMFMPKQWVQEFLDNKEIDKIGLVSLMLHRGWLQDEHIPRIIDVKDVDLRARIASLPGLARDIQQILVKDKSAGVRAALARNPITESEILMQLLGDKSVTVLEYLKSETYYAEEGGKWVMKNYVGREALIAAASGSAKNLAKLSKVTSVTGRSEALLSEVIDEKRYQELLADKSIGIQTSATLRAAELGLISFKEAAAFVSKFAPQTSAPKNKWVEARMESFRREHNEFFLDLVIELRGDDVLCGIFLDGNLQLSADKLMKIAKAHLANTNWNMARNVELNADLLDEIAETPSWSYDTYGYPEEKLEFGQWAGETSSGYRVASYPQAIAASHPKTRLETLEKLKKSRSKYVRGVIMERSEVFNYDDLKKAVKDKEAYVRILAAKHPLVDLELLEKLANDSDPEVRAAACEHKLATPEMKATAALLKN